MVGLFVKKTTLCGKLLHFVVKNFFYGRKSHCCDILQYFFSALRYIVVY